MNKNHKQNAEKLLQLLMMTDPLPLKEVNRPMHAYAGEGHQAFITRNKLCYENGKDLYLEETSKPKRIDDFLWYMGNVAKEMFGIAVSQTASRVRRCHIHWAPPSSVPPTSSSKGSFNTAGGTSI
jgi:hypothetical protein